MLFGSAGSQVFNLICLVYLFSIAAGVNWWVFAAAFLVGFTINLIVARARG